MHTHAHIAFCGISNVAPRLFVLALRFYAPARKPPNSRAQPRRVAPCVGLVEHPAWNVHPATLSVEDRKTVMRWVKQHHPFTTHPLCWRNNNTIVFHPPTQVHRAYQASVQGSGRRRRRGRRQGRHGARRDDARAVDLHGQRHAPLPPVHALRDGGAVAAPAGWVLWQRLPRGCMCCV
jgi:hypothetical protein